MQFSLLELDVSAEQGNGAPRGGEIGCPGWPLEELPTLPTAHPSLWNFMRTGRHRHVDWDYRHAHSGGTLDAVCDAGTQADGYLPSGNRIPCFDKIRSHCGKANPACDKGIPRSDIDIPRRRNPIPANDNRFPDNDNPIPDNGNRIPCYRAG